MYVLAVVCQKFAAVTFMLTGNQHNFYIHCVKSSADLVC